MRKHTFDHPGYLDSLDSAEPWDSLFDSATELDEPESALADTTDAAEDASLIAVYLRDAARYPKLSAAEERELSRRIREQNDADAEERFIQCNLRLVVSVAKEYQAQGMSLLDLIQEGNIGLMKAVKRYDGRKGFRFSTYAVWWIRQQITRAIWSTHGPMRIPSRVIDEHRRLLREQRLDEQRAGEQPPDGVTVTGETEAVARQETPETPSPWSIVAISNEEAEQHLATLPVGESESPVQQVENRELLETILKALQSVSQRDQQIISELFGLDDTTPAKLEHVANRHHLTCERVRQIKKAVFESIRRSPYAAQLAAY